MEQEEPNDVIVLSAINQGVKKFDKISKKTKIDGQELNTLLARLEEKGFIALVEKKGWLGSPALGWVELISRAGLKAVG